MNERSHDTCRVFRLVLQMFSKLVARLSEFRNWHNDVCGRQDGISDDRGDVTTGSRRGSQDVDGDQAGYDGVRSATHLGPRRGEGCLRGNDDGV